MLECCREEGRNLISGAQRWELESDHDLAGRPWLRKHDVIKEVAIQVTNEWLAVGLNLQCVVKRFKLRVVFPSGWMSHFLPVDYLDVSGS